MLHGWSGWSRNRRPLISKQSVEKIGIIFALQHDLLWTQFSVKKENVNPKCMYNLSAIFSYSTILLHQGPYLMNILHSPLMIVSAGVLSRTYKLRYHSVQQLVRYHVNDYHL